MGKKILFLVPYPLHESPSQRFRFEQYFELLQAKEYSYTIESFLNIDNWKVFYSKGKRLSKCIALVEGFVKRIIATVKSPMYDFIFIHREITPVGPPVFEWILAKIIRKKIVYDFDDAIWLTDRQREPRFLSVIKWRTKVSSICRWSYKVSCGNQYLCDYALTFSKKVCHNPTTIDTENFHNPALLPMYETKNRIRIGWTGSHSTLKYLNEIEMVLGKILSENPQTELLIIADQAPILPSIPAFTFIPWNPLTEIKDLMLFDIGIMPLPDDPWAKGKCGFKALQYMALEIPAVTSRVGVNSTIIDEGLNGFLCRGDQEWEDALIKLIKSPTLRRSMGLNGRKRVINNYSVLSNSTNFLSLFE